MLDTKGSAMTLHTLLFTVALLLASCAGKETPPVAQPDISNARLDISGPSIEITYLRGMNSHRFVLNEGSETGRIQCYRDHRLLKEIRIGKDKYSELAKESAGVLAALERHPAQKAAAPCRTPFTFKMSDTHESRIIEGCRSTDEAAALGKLIKDVEFIMMSEDQARK